MNLIDLFWGLVNGILGSFFQDILKPLLEAVQHATMSPEAIRDLPYFVPLCDAFVGIGVGLWFLILIWKVLGSMFAWMEIEVEAPTTLLMRSLFFIFFVVYSKDILMMGITYSASLGSLLLDAITDKDSFSLIIGTVLDSAVAGLHNPLSWIPIAYVIYKCLWLTFRVFKRMILCSILVIVGPAAFACGVSKSTAGYLSGYLRVFVGNLLTQFIHMAIMVMLAIYWQAYGGSAFVEFYHFAVIVVIIQLAESLEDIIRDASASVGLGRGGSTVASQATNLISTGLSLVRR